MFAIAQTPMSFDAVVSFALPDLKVHFSEGNSQSLRDLRAYLGLGSGGTKEENRGLIYDHIEKHRHMQAGLQPVVASSVSVVLVDPLPDPWKRKAETKSTDIANADNDCKIKKPQFEKSRGNLDLVKKIAERQNAETTIAEPPQPRWAARLLASPHRVGSSRGL